jgi:hypothetical protein
VLFNTLLAGADNVDEGLVQQESPFAGAVLLHTQAACTTSAA